MLLFMDVYANHSGGRGGTSKTRVTAKRGGQVSKTRGASRGGSTTKKRTGVRGVRRRG